MSPSAIQGQLLESIGESGLSQGIGAYSPNPNKGREGRDCIPTPT